jgi:hypothetical protein
MGMAAGKPKGERPGRALAVRVTLLSLTVGTLVAVVSALAGSGICSGPGPGSALSAGPVDRVCYQLVRTLSERVGLMSAGATAVIVLTMVGLSRLAGGPEQPTPLTTHGAESPEE